MKLVQTNFNIASLGGSVHGDAHGSNTSLQSLCMEDKNNGKELIFIAQCELCKFCCFS